jgi:hypothetical protein
MTVKPRCSTSWRRSSNWVSQFCSMVETRAYSAARFTGVPPQQFPGARVRPTSDAGREGTPSAAPSSSAPPARKDDAHPPNIGDSSGSGPGMVGWSLSCEQPCSCTGASLAHPLLRQGRGRMLGNKLPDRVQQHFCHFHTFSRTGGLESAMQLGRYDETHTLIPLLHIRNGIHLLPGRRTARKSRFS